MRDWGSAFDGINPDRRIFDEDWVKADTPWDPPTHYMHHGMRQSDYMEDLVTQTWQNLGKPYHFTEDQLFRMLREALGQGEQEEVRELHETRHPSMQLQSIDDLLEPYKHQQASGTRAYDVYTDMPAIQDYQLPPSLQPGNKEEFHQRKEEITKHLRDRNYSNQDIFQKLDELLLDLGGDQDTHILSSRWS